MSDDNILEQNYVLSDDNIRDHNYVLSDDNILDHDYVLSNGNISELYVVWWQSSHMHAISGNVNAIYHVISKNVACAIDCSKRNQSIKHSNELETIVISMIYMYDDVQVI